MQKNETTNKTLNTKDITNELYLELSEKGLVKSRKQTKDIINAFVAFLLRKIMEGFRIKIMNFGSFQLVKRAPKHGRNPITGESVVIPAKQSINFKISQNLYKDINSK